MSKTNTTASAQIKIPAGATKAEIASWARGQMVKLGRPADPCLGDDAVIGALVLYLVIDQKPTLAVQVADQAKLQDLASAVRRCAARAGITV